MSRSLQFVSALALFLIAACCTSTAHQTDTHAATPAAAAAPASPGAGEVPEEVMAKARADLARQVGAGAAASARVVAAERVMWPNGAMGCPQPGRMYTQAIVPGYRVEFEAGGRRYAYHASEKGGFVLCQHPAAAQPPSSER